MARVTVAEKIEAAGGEAFVCEKLISGYFYSDIAGELGISKTALAEWIYSNDERRARAKKCQEFAADELVKAARDAVMGIPDGNDPGAIARGKETASHFRWMAERLSQDKWGNRQKVDTQGSVTIRFDNLDQNA